MNVQLGAVDYVDQWNTSDGTFWQKYRFQVPIILLLTAAIQFGFAQYAYAPFGWTQISANSIYTSLAANLGGLFWYRKMRSYPGTRRFAFILPSLAFSWAGVIVVIAVFRIPYSVVLLSLGAVCGSTLAFLFIVLARRPFSEVFQVIPGPRVDAALNDLPDLPHKLCESASDIVSSRGAIVADLHADMAKDWDRAIVQATLEGRQIYHIKQIHESLTGRVQVDHLSENALGTLAPDESYLFARSVIERLIAAIALICVSPLLVLLVIAIRFDSEGPAFFRQIRAGRGGRDFEILKLRTMFENNDHATLEADITRENDPRITRLGKVLRHLRLDELPQLFNVLKGEMSFIGPRPETKRLSNWYAANIDFYSYRHVVPPGITGWAQVRQGHVASDEEVSRKIQYDLYYVKHFSPWLDAVVFLKTVKVIVFKLGAK